MTMRCLLALPKRKGTKNSLKDNVVTVESLDIKQRIVPTRKVIKKKVLKTNLKKGDKKTKKDSKGNGKIDMSKIRCYNLTGF